MLLYCVCVVFCTLFGRVFSLSVGLGRIGCCFHALEVKATRERQEGTGQGKDGGKRKGHMS